MEISKLISKYFFIILLNLLFANPLFAITVTTTPCKDKMAFPKNVSGASLSDSKGCSSYKNRSWFSISASHISSPPEEEIIKGRDIVMSMDVVNAIESGNINELASFLSTTLHDNNEPHQYIKGNQEIVKNCFEYFYKNIEAPKVETQQFLSPDEKMWCGVFSQDKAIRMEGRVVAEVDTDVPILVIGFLTSEEKAALNYIPAAAVRSYSSCRQCFD